MPIDVQVVEGAILTQRKVAWTATGLVEEPKLAIQTERLFDEVLQLRRSSRLIEGISLDCTLSFIRHVFRIREIGQGGNAGLARKPSISAGALHPIEVIIVAGPQVQEPILFADHNDQFLTLSVKNFGALANAVVAYRKIIPTARGHLLLFTGDRRRVSRKYRLN